MYISIGVILLIAAIAFGYFVAYKRPPENYKITGRRRTASRKWNVLDWLIVAALVLLAIYLFLHPHKVADIVWWLIVAVAIFAVAIIFIAEAVAAIFLAALGGIVLLLGLVTSLIGGGSHDHKAAPSNSPSASATSSSTPPASSSSAAPASTPASTLASTGASKPPGGGTEKNPREVGLGDARDPGDGGFVPGNQLLNDLRNSNSNQDFLPSYNRTELNALAKTEEDWIRKNASGNKCLDSLAASFVHDLRAADLAQYMKDHLQLREVTSSDGLTAWNTWCTPQGKLQKWDVQTFPQKELVWFKKGTDTPAMKFVCGNRLYPVTVQHTSSPTPTPAPSSSTPVTHTTTPSAPRTTTHKPTPSKTTSTPKPNTKPTGNVNKPKHMYVATVNKPSTFVSTVTGHDAEDGSNVHISVSVTGAASGGTSCTGSCSFTIYAGRNPGPAYIHVVITDSRGATYAFTEQFPVVADDFG